MPAETLLTAARRLNRFFRIDMKKGGLIVDETLAALETLELQIQQAQTGAEQDAIVLPAAIAAARDLRLDTSDHGGMIRIPTEIAFDTLDKAIRTADAAHAKETAHVG